MNTLTLSSSPGQGRTDEAYAGEIDFNNNSGVNLDTTVLPAWTNPSQVAAGTMAYNTWYKLEFTVDSTTLATNFNSGASTTSGTSSKYSSGYAGVGLDIQTSTIFDNFYVRQYAATVPANSVGLETAN